MTDGAATTWARVHSGSGWHRSLCSARDSGQLAAAHSLGAGTLGNARRSPSGGSTLISLAHQHAMDFSRDAVDRYISPCAIARGGCTIGCASVRSLFYAP